MLKVNEITMTKENIYYVGNKIDSKNQIISNKQFLSPDGVIFPINKKTVTKQKYKFGGSSVLGTKQMVSNATSNTINTINLNSFVTTNPDSHDFTDKKNLTNDQLYQEAASILGLTCLQSDNCECIDCQCHYFDYVKELHTNSDNEESPCCIQ